MNVSNFATTKGYDEQLYGVSRYVPQVRLVHILSLLFFAFIADYAWMLYMRWRMVRIP